MGNVRILLLVVFCAAALIPAMPARADEQPAPPAEAQVRPLAPTYRIYATRQGLVGRRTANGHIIQPRDRFVALPSFRVLSSRGGNEFQVRVTYRDRSVILPVWDVGPWNTTDDYWDPDRKYGDLPVGLPMAQAARLQGYNGGRDDFGRRVRLPNGVDIADGAFWDDLGMAQSDWVEISFLWLGDDPGPPPPHDPPALIETDRLPPVARVREAIPQGDGSWLIRWDGYDDVIGIASYDVQTRRLPDGEWVDWQVEETFAEARFWPSEPGEWAFRARAQDWLGREQEWETEPDLVVTFR
ncbi:MAG TPA: hypothetical protein PKA05_01685 [Roseiflexaceae bacterium]|nr:hypothetical protein [Roseiflexaceae bacterium]